MGATCTGEKGLDGNVCCTGYRSLSPRQQLVSVSEQMFDQNEMDRIVGMQKVWRKVLERRAAVTHYMKHLPKTVPRKDTLHIRVSLNDS